MQFIKHFRGVSHFSTKYQTKTIFGLLQRNGKKVNFCKKYISKMERLIYLNLVKIARFSVKPFEK